jgi:hypothetical protein
MPRYWFTRHFPKPPSLSIPWFVYFRQTDHMLAEKLSQGDIVVFYETATGKAMKFAGEKEFVPKLKGRGAVVGVGTVTGGIELVPKDRVVEFKGVPIAEFQSQLRCKEHQRGRPVPVEKVKKILNVKIPFIIKGAVKEIDVKTYNEFVNALSPLVQCSPYEL